MPRPAGDKAAAPKEFFTRTSAANNTVRHANPPSASSAFVVSPAGDCPVAQPLTQDVPPCGIFAHQECCGSQGGGASQLQLCMAFLSPLQPLLGLQPTSMQAVHCEWCSMRPRPSPEDSRLQPLA